ncbi:hypothetical protein SAMN05421853_10469 [Roseivivax halotolerans]|jgi:hypothetical protein|uniref:Uncharacterized protein n=1 Tax=Roseivivax halotolerans TaxID=93684 RepID=A0A1I5XRG4_9RHOB|nr:MULTISPECIES: hypothetical protein [Roseivivax]QFT62381.1 hypothetical protein FIU91_05520 [Roseivivax sp. THAF30]SFQ34561.1 hypothetical protein SAMN05421853_10469 [Roseivivax halotolerans]
MFRTASAALAASLFAAPALAQECTATVNASEIVINTEELGEDRSSPGIRERLVDWPSRRWDRARGRPPECDSQTIITYLADQVPAQDVNGYCLSELEETGYILVPGARNYRGRCTETACQKVNAAADATVSTTAALASAVQRKSGETKERLDGVVHGSGALILSGSRDLVLGALGSAGTAALGTVGAPVAAVGAGVTLVGVGGALYYCSGSEGPDLPPLDGQFQNPEDRDPSLQ